MRKTPKIALLIAITALSGCATEPFEPGTPDSPSPRAIELTELGRAAAKACIIQFKDVASVDKASEVLIAAGYKQNEKQWEGMRGFTKSISGGVKSIWGDNMGRAGAALPTKADFRGRLRCRASAGGFNAKAPGDIFYRAFAKEIASSAIADETRVYGTYRNGSGDVGAIYSPKKSSQ